MSKSIIRKQTLEKIAIHLGELFSGPTIVEHLKSWGVPDSLIEYPNTKWRMVYSVLWHYADSSEAQDRAMLLKIIAEILHPLLYNGSWERSQEVCKEFNDLLFYDNFEATWSIDKKMYILSYEPTEEELEMMYEQQADEWVEEAKKEQKFWKNPENKELVSTLKKAYQVLINIADVFCQDPKTPTNDLNTAYLKTKQIVVDTKGELVQRAYNLYEIRAHLQSLYFPFQNLFSAEIESKNRGLNISWDDIRPKMHSSYGDIDSLFRKAEASDVISASDTQKVLNDTSLLLSQIKEQNEAMTNARVSSPKSTREPLEVRLVQGSQVAIEKLGNEPKYKFPHKLPRGTKWENITIKFIDDDTVQILAQGKGHTTSYSEMGLEGKGGKPSVLWTFLRVLAMYSGEIKATDPQAVDSYKKTKQSLSDALEVYFGIDFDPFLPFQDNKSYQVKFTLLPPQGGFSFEKKRKANPLEKPVTEDPFADLGSYMGDVAPVVAQAEATPKDDR